MSITIEELETQISELQKNLEILKSSKLEVSREFIGQYFQPHKGLQYRRMESEGVPVWECFLDTKWNLLSNTEYKELEELYQKDYISPNSTPRKK